MNIIKNQFILILVMLSMLPLSGIEPPMVVPDYNEQYGKIPPAPIYTFDLSSMYKDYGVLTSCRDFAEQKYKDVVNYVTIAAAYENHPAVGVYQLFAVLEFLGTSPTYSGIGYEQPVDISKTRSKNIFHEVIYHMNKIAEFTGTETTVPHIKNGLYLKYANDSNLPGGVPVYQDSTAASVIEGIFNSGTVCVCENPSETGWDTDVCTACNGAGLVTQDVAAYRSAYYSQFTGPGDLGSLETGAAVVANLKEKLISLLIQRANVETIWQERKEEILSMHPEDDDIYGVADINQGTIDLLEKLTIFRDVNNIQEINDVTDGDLLRPYTHSTEDEDKELLKTHAVKNAQIRLFEELQAELRTKVRTTRFTDTPEAEKLWNQHYMNTRYYLDSFTDDMRGSMDKEVRQKWYPNGETEYLIETVLSQIDDRIANILITVTGDTVGTITVPNCINGSGTDLTVCDYDPAWFLKEVGRMVRPGSMESSYKECVDMTKNDSNAFGTDLMNISPGILESMPNMYVFIPENGWGVVGRMLNLIASGEADKDDPLDDNNTLRKMERVLQQYKLWKKLYRKENNGLSSIQEYFHFGANLWEFHEIDSKNPELGYEQKCMKYYIDPEGDNENTELHDGVCETSFTPDRYEDVSLKNRFENVCFGAEAGGNATMTPLLASTDPEEGYKYWKCFERWMDAYPIYMEELQTIEGRMAIIEASYKLLKARMAARKLKKSGMLDPEIPPATTPGDPAPDPSKKNKNPFGIPSSLEKWFSNYLQFGVDDLNANFNFIAGLGVKNLVLDPNAYNPIQYLKNADAFIPHLGKAMLKYADPQGYEDTMNKNPHKVEVAAVILGQHMIANLKNVNKLGKMYEGVFETIQQFDPEKIKALFSGRGLKNLVDEEKILEIIGQELAAEAMTKIMAYSAPTGTKPIDARAVLQAFQRGSNIMISDEAQSFANSGDCSEKEGCLEVLQEIEMRRSEIEGVVRAWESMMQENANIIRTEIKTKYGAGQGLYKMITNMVNAGNPLKGLMESAFKKPLYDMLIDSILNGAIPKDLSGNPISMKFSCVQGTVVTDIALINEKGDQVDKLIEGINDCNDLEITINNESQHLDFSDPEHIKKILATVVDYKSLLKSAATDVAMDYVLNTFKVDADIRDMVKQILKTVLNSQAKLKCLPKILEDSSNNASLSCGNEDELLINELIVDQDTSGLNLSLITVLTRTIRELRQKNGTISETIHGNAKKELAKITDMFMKQMPMFKNDANMKLRLLTSTLITQVTILVSDVQNILNLVLNGNKLKLDEFVEDDGGKLKKILLTTVNRLIEKAVTCGTEQTSAEECGNQGGVDEAGNLCNLDSIDSECSINSFMKEFSNIGANLKDDADGAIPELGEKINDLKGVDPTIGTDLTNIIGIITGVLESSDVNYSISTIDGQSDEEILLSGMAGNSLRSNLNIFISAFKTLGVKSIIPDYEVTDSTGEAITPPNPSTPDLDWGSLQNLDVAADLSSSSATVTFNPTINLGSIKGALLERFMKLAEPAMQQSNNVMELAELVTQGYWQELLESMQFPEVDSSFIEDMVDLQTSLTNLDTTTTGGLTTYKTSIIDAYDEFLPTSSDPDGKFINVDLDPIIAGAVAQDLASILIDPQFYARVMKRLTDEIGIVSTFKEIFNGVKEGGNDSALDWLLAEHYSGTPLNDLSCEVAKRINLDTNEGCTFAGLNEIINANEASLTQVLATAVAMRIEEIFMKELLKIPYGEVCAHHTSGLHLFGFDADLLEATFYVTTRLQKDKYGRLIDLENVNPKSREAFSRRYEGKVEKFKPYTKYFFFAQNVSFDDLAASAIEAGKQALEGAVEAAQEKIEEKLAKYADDVSDANSFQSRIAKDPKLEQFEFANLEKGGTVNFQIGPVPAYVSFGIVFRAGMRYGLEYNAGWFRGLTLGASAGPYIVLGAYIEVGVGFDYEWLSVKIGIWGAIDVFDFYAPLKVQGMLKPELSFDGLAVKFYLLTSLEPELYLLAGRIAFAVSGRIGVAPLAISFNLRGKIFEWDPLIKKKFGNIIPLKPIDFDLFSIGRGIKVMGNEVATF